MTDQLLSTETPVQFRGYWTRPDTDDASIVGELPWYQKHLMEQIEPDDHVLDIGGHIGVMARVFCERAFNGHVTSVEPDPGNLHVHRLNVTAANLTRLHGAVVPGRREDDETVTLWRNPGKGQCMHTLVKKRGRLPLDVPALGFDDLLEQFQPTVLKVDIEGGEYPLLADRLPPESVRVFMVELHRTRQSHRELALEAHQRLFAAGWQPVSNPPDLATTTWWAVPIVYVRS